MRTTALETKTALLAYYYYILFFIIIISVPDSIGLERLKRFLYVQVCTWCDVSARHAGGAVHSFAPSTTPTSSMIHHAAAPLSSTLVSYLTAAFSLGTPIMTLPTCLWNKPRFCHLLCTSAGGQRNKSVHAYIARSSLVVGYWFCRILIWESWLSLRKASNLDSAL